MNKGPHIFISSENYPNSVLDQLMNSGLDQSVKSSVSPANLIFTENYQPRLDLSKNLDKSRSTTTKHLTDSRWTKKSDFVGEFRKIKLVRKAAKKFLNGNSYRLYHRLKKVHYRIIGDPLKEAGENEKDYKQGVKKSTQQIFDLINLWKKIPVLDPTDKVKLVWDLFILLLIVSNFFYLSLELFFDPIFDFFPDEGFNAFTILMLSIDIFIKFKTSYYYYGAIVKSHRKIRLNYYKTELLQDALAVLALIFHLSFASNTYYKWVILLFFGKVRTINNIIRNFENVVDFGEVFELFGVMFKVLCVAHIYACFWHYITYLKNQNQNLKTWIDDKHIQDADWRIKYIYSIYWALATMVTVGYGDITPQNQYEVAFSAFTILSGSLVFGYCLNRIGTLLANIDERDKELKQNVKIMENYMRTHNITGELKGRAIKYLEFTWKSERKNIEKEQNLLEKLPESLKNEILFESNQKSLLHFKILKNNFSEEILNKLSTTLRTVQFSPNELIYSKGDFETNNPCLYLIANGKADVFFNQRIIRSLQKNDSFGEYEFFTNNPYQETIKSAEFTTLYKISLKLFLQILKNYPEQYEKFCSIRDKLSLYSHYSPLFSSCPSCNKDSHSLSLCPLTAYIPNKSLLLSKLTFSCPQPRKPYPRPTFRSIHAVNSLPRCRLAAFKIRFNPRLMYTFLSALDPNQPNKYIPSSQELFSLNTVYQRINMPRTIDSFSLQSFRDLGAPMQHESKKWKSMEMLHFTDSKQLRAFDTSMDIGHPATSNASNALKQKLDSPSRKNKEGGSGMFPSPINSGEEIFFEEKKEKGALSPQDGEFLTLMSRAKSRVRGQTKIIVENANNNKKLEKIEENEELLLLKKRKKSSLDDLSEDDSMNLDLQKIDSDFVMNKETRLLVPKKKNFSRLASRKPRITEKEKTIFQTTEKKPDSNPEVLAKKDIKHRENNSFKLFDYEFDEIKTYQNYFFEGNCRNVVKRIVQFKAKSSPRVMSPRTSIRKRQQSPSPFKLEIKK